MKGKEKLVATDLVGMLLNADASTLASIETELASLEKEIDEFVSRRKSRLEALRKLHKLVSVAVHGTQPKAASNGKTRTNEIITRVYELIDQEGSMPVGAIAARLSMKPTVIGRIVQVSPLFEKRDGEIHLAP